MKIKTGLAAFGLSGQVFHAPFIEAHPNFKLTAIVERSRKKAAETYPHIRSVASFDELLRQDIELVVVDTPDATHYALCRAALEAGKHVVVEKPFVTTRQQAEELIGLAEHRGLRLTVYQTRRWDGDFLSVRRIVESGALGRIVEFQSSFQRYRPQITQSVWKEAPDGARVGITYNLCSHLCDQAVALFGKPEGVWATLASQRDGSRIDDYSFIELMYPGVKVSLRAGMLIREEGPRFAVHGTAGSYVKYGLDPQENALRHEGAVPTTGTWCRESEEKWGILHTDEGRRKYPTLAGNYMRFYDGMYASIRENAAPVVSHEDMLTDLAILDAAFESHRTGRVVRL